MKIFSNNIHNGQYDKQVGRLGGQCYPNKDLPNRSFHIGWKDLPKGTKSLALVFLDYDAIPVCGFCWIHWTVVDIDPSLGELPENASIDLKKSLIQGVNSCASELLPLPEAWHLTREEATSYIGCAPPDKPHVYTIEVYALDTMLNLKNSFYANEMHKKMQGHVLAKAMLEAEYPNE